MNSSLLLLVTLTLTLCLVSVSSRPLPPPPKSDPAPAHRILPSEWLSTCTDSDRGVQFVEEGPYYINEPTTGDRNNIEDENSPGVPLAIVWTLFNTTASGCVVLPNVLVDIWHANYAGIYSGTPDQNSTAYSFSRGWQYSDARGQVVFRTTYPGWYPGRAPHIHIRARTFNLDGDLVYDDVSQLFFTDALSDQVYSLPPYNKYPNRDTRNGDDEDFAPHNIMNITGDYKGPAGLVGTFLVGVPLLDRNSTMAYQMAKKMDKKMSVMQTGEN